MSPSPMLKLDLSLYPDPVLRKVAEPVTEFGPELSELVAAMFETMYASKGVGLAAPQVGLKKRVLVLNPSGDPDQTDQALVLVNPAIVDRSGAPTLFDEGCLSFPGIYAEVERPDRCRVQAKNAAGEPFEGEYDAFVSRIVQHEYDHLEGVLLVDRMSPADKQRHKAALAQLVDDFRRRKAGSGR